MSESQSSNRVLCITTAGSPWRNYDGRPAVGDKVRVVRTSEDEALVFCYNGTVNEEGLLQTVSGDMFDILEIRPDDEIYGWTKEVIVLE